MKECGNQGKSSQDSDSTRTWKSPLPPNKNKAEENEKSTTLFGCMKKDQGLTAVAPKIGETDKSIQKR